MIILLHKVNHLPDNSKFVLFSHIILIISKICYKIIAKENLKAHLMSKILKQLIEKSSLFFIPYENSTGPYLK